MGHLRGAITAERRNLSSAFTPFDFMKPLSLQETPNERAQILLDIRATSGDGEFD